MLDVRTPPAKESDTHNAALWATAFAVPIAVLVALMLVWRLSPEGEAATTPVPSATGAVAVPATPVQMAAPPLAAHAAQVCLAVTSQLPSTVRDLAARKVSAGPEQNAAYGEPPITVACGVPQPSMCETVTGGHPGCVPLTADLLLMNGVCWYGEDGPVTRHFTTMDREVAVQVAVPASYRQPAQWANEFSDAVRQAVASRTAGVPTGCR